MNAPEETKVKTEITTQGLSRMRRLLRKMTLTRQDSKGVSMIVSVSEAIFGATRGTTGRSASSTYLIVHYMLRLIVLVLCLLGCFAQIGTIMSIYFSYPAIVFVDLHQMDKLLLPGMTICNENRVMRSKLRAYDMRFANEWLVWLLLCSRLFSYSVLLHRNRLMNQTTQQTKALKLHQQQLMDNLIRTMLTNLTVAQFMTLGNTADDFLDVSFFKCASDKNHASQKCILLSNLLTTAQENGNCFTMFHKSTSTELDEIAINSGLSESAVVRGTVNESVNIEMSLKPFAPNEIIRLRVNFREEEYTTLNEPVSGRFIIHDNREVAVIREKSYRIEPGKYYIFYLTKLTDELLPAPYFTDCRDYRRSSEQNVAGHNISNNILLNSPSSKSNCIIGCIAKKTIETCNCWPPELPFLYIGLDNSSLYSLKWCDWRERPPITNWTEKPNHLTWFQYCFNVHETECNGLCKPDCSMDRYRITKEEIEWPSRERIERSEEGAELQKLHTCCAVISIRYWTAEQKINKYKPRFELAEFTSYVGGLLSMWLGFSLFSFYGLSERTVVRVVSHFIQKRRGAKEPILNITNLSGISHLVTQPSSTLKSSKVHDILSRHRQTPLIRKIHKWQAIY